jgi:hypothetical protein
MGSEEPTGSVSFDEDDIETYAYATLVKCDTGRNEGASCGGHLVWEKNGSVCRECTRAFCEGCCSAGGGYDSDDDYWCADCVECLKSQRKGRSIP